ncbi:oxysterol-binding protein-related protein 9 [Agrilus planipennis]|uniref:Oxysterol-binding protein n=1 Tax=Agrilus planipennis TaxID=224129 RepID=A0A7F5R840_AGRPL|nr:oxysterol-binding protein-related protein 9 [Agrilus planipennis]
MTVMEGSLSKWTNVMKGWQYRWFVLDESSGILSYYTSKEKMMRGVRRGCVRLKGAVIGIDDEDDSTFTITVDHKTFHFQARDAEEREKWVRALEDTIYRHAHRTKWDTMRPPPTVKDFDNKVSEADAYLQLMIDQTKKLEEKINSMNDPEEKTKCEVILTHANSMLHNIKHSIVLLQIAKVSIIYIHFILEKFVYYIKVSTTNISNVSDIVTFAGDSVVQHGIELGSECIENARRISRTLAASNADSLVVPETSYSSSEGEDDFFDANDVPFSNYSSQLSSSSGIHPLGDTTSDFSTTTTTAAAAPGGNTATRIRISTRQLHNNSVDNQECSGSPNGNSGSIDYDALYEDEEEDDVEIESHGSVIKHLLSQVKIGMDLTKVVLPTFILERRSLLEMYADYFAHPDLFVRIADLRDPKDRMIQVVKWYLSSYHAGRKSSVAKKPYNPILGEVFRCYWDLPSISEDSCNRVPDGPIPWANQNELTFVAEQVSHHPPISAFYAEHYQKKISFNAHIYTKSKFLGLSVCVYNIGEGVISLLEYDEEYTVTFPNGYGRSILTVPWIELGGNVTIKCPKTGYQCNIDFLTKPFYGNKKHKVNAEVAGPDCKVFLTISGEWNGLMEAKWVDKDKTEVFIDVNKLSTIKKRVRPIAEQEENESRKLWKEVTRGLKYNEIDKASHAKEEIENRQRAQAKERTQTNAEWQTKLFHKETEERWKYNSPLKERLKSSKV